MKIPVPNSLISLKEATKRLVTACGGIVTAASLIGKSKTQVQRYAAPDHANVIIGVLDAVTLEKASGRLYVTGWMAHEHGALLVHLPQRKPTDGLHRLLAAVGRHTANTFAHYADAPTEPLSDRRRALLVTSLDDLLSAATEARAHLEAWGTDR